MKDFLFFAAVYGTAASLAILAVGAPFRAFGIWLDQKLFPHRWIVVISEDRRGGAIRIFVHCPACISFWTGVLFSWLVHSPARTHLALPLVSSLIIDGLASAGIIWCVHVVLTRLGQYDL